MNYLEHYNRLIDKAKLRNWGKKTAPVYVEIHHIVPKCAGGDNSDDNLIVLTPEEHFVAHLLLAKIFKHTHLYYKMVLAVTAMCISHDNMNRNNKQIGWAKRASSEAHKKENLDPDVLRKIREGCKRRPNRPHTEETKRKISVSSKRPRKPHTEETKRKMSATSKGRPGRTASEETRNKIKESLAKIPLITCPHCNRQSKKTSFMQNRHFDNCKDYSQL